MISKEALSYLVDLGDAQTFEVDGVTYHGNKPIEKPEVTPILTSTLSSICDYIEANVDKNAEMVVHVGSEKTTVYGPLMRPHNTRDVLMVAEMPRKHVPFGQFRSTEEWIITLQTAFERTKDWGKVMALIGNVADCQTKQFSDDGLSQCVTAQTSVASKANVAVPSLVELVPMIGFANAPRVSGTYVLRARGGSESSKPMFALFEADSADYEYRLMQAAGNWLKDALVAFKNVHVIY